MSGVSRELLQPPLLDRVASSHRPLLELDSSISPFFNFTKRCLSHFPTARGTDKIDARGSAISTTRREHSASATRSERARKLHTRSLTKPIAGPRQWN
jgi:hypothetical protein